LERAAGYARQLARSANSGRVMPTFKTRPQAEAEVDHARLALIIKR
jgi:hypothetical protein